MRVERCREDVERMQKGFVILEVVLSGGRCSFVSKMYASWSLVEDIETSLGDPLWAWLGLEEHSVGYSWYV